MAHKLQHLKETLAELKSTHPADATSKSPLPPPPHLARLRCRRTLRGHYAKIYSLAWGTNHEVVSASQDGKLIVWDAHAATKQAAISLRSSWVMTCAYANLGGKRLVGCGGLDNICSLYDIDTHAPSKVVAELVAHTGYVSCCRFGPDQTAVTASGDMSCIRWDVETATPLNQYAEHDGDVMCLAVAPHGGKLFVSAACDALAKVSRRRGAQAPS